MDSNQRLLVPSQAGMRLIAQTSIYNTGDFGRLLRYLNENYTEAALAAGSADDRLRFLRDVRARVGRLRVKHVISVEKHHVVVLMETERGEDFFVQDLECEADYPHRITQFDHYRVDVEFKD